MKNKFFLSCLCGVAFIWMFFTPSEALSQEKETCSKINLHLCTTENSCEQAKGYWCSQRIKKGGTSSIFEEEVVSRCVPSAKYCSSCPVLYTMEPEVKYYDATTHKNMGKKGGSICLNCPEKETFGTPQSCCPGYGVANGRTCSTCSTDHNKWIYYPVDYISADLEPGKTPDKYIYCVDCEANGTTSVENEYFTVKSADNNMKTREYKGSLSYQVDSMGRKFSHTACNCPAERPFVDGKGNCVKCGLYFAHWDTKLDMCVCNEGYSQTGYSEDGYLMCIEGGVARRNSKECETNQDCLAGEYCYKENETCEDEGIPGECKSLGQKTIGQVNGKEIVLSKDDLTFRNAERWCQAQNKSFIDITEFECFASSDSIIHPGPSNILMATDSGVSGLCCVQGKRCPFYEYMHENWNKIGEYSKKLEEYNQALSFRPNIVWTASSAKKNSNSIYTINFRNKLVRVLDSCAYEEQQALCR